MNVLLNIDECSLLINEIKFMVSSKGELYTSTSNYGVFSSSYYCLVIGSHYILLFFLSSITRRLVSGVPHYLLSMG